MTEVDQDRFRYRLYLPRDPALCGGLFLISSKGFIVNFSRKKKGRVPRSPRSSKNTSQVPCEVRDDPLHTRVTPQATRSGSSGPHGPRALCHHRHQAASLRKRMVVEVRNLIGWKLGCSLRHSMPLSSDWERSEILKPRGQLYTCGSGDLQLGNNASCRFVTMHERYKFRIEFFA